MLGGRGGIGAVAIMVNLSDGGCDPKPIFLHREPGFQDGVLHKVEPGHFYVESKKVSS